MGVETQLFYFILFYFLKNGRRRAYLAQARDDSCEGLADARGVLWQRALSVPV
jgi:hypothetical protein